MVFSFGKSPNGTFSILQRKEKVTNTGQNSEVNILFGLVMSVVVLLRWRLHTPVLGFRSYIFLSV